MKFYLIEIAEGDSKIAGKGVFEYEKLNDAVANFHSKLAIAMKSEMYTSDLIMVIDSDGCVHYSEKFVREIIQPEPIEAPTEEN